MSPDLLSSTLTHLLGQSPFIGLLAIIIYTSYKGVWVWGRDYQKLEKQRDWWQQLALNGTSLAKEQVSLLTATTTLRSSAE